MHRLFLPVMVCSLLLVSFRAGTPEPVFVKDNFLFAEKQLTNMLLKLPADSLTFPRSIDSSGKLKATDMYDWTPGFFPGSLWYTYAYTKKTPLKEAAIRWTEKLEPLKTFTGHHDLGFMMYCSYGNAYRQTGNPLYKDILVRAARSLSTRFNPVTGCIKSWNTFNSWHRDHIYNFPVIIDNMMNLELLFFASKVTGDTSFRHIAVTHALNTMKNHVRSDYSSFHVVCYDTVTGKVLARETAQGYADNSTWSRGQAWGIYGFTMTYRETKDRRFLQTAQGMADWFVYNKSLPADKIPYWDFNASQPGYMPAPASHASGTTIHPRDASAAAILTSALLELSTYSDTARAGAYKRMAIQILHSLASPAYRATPGANQNFLLMHSTGSVAHGFEIDVPLVYADYYFLEALYRYNRLLKGKSVLEQ